MIPRTKKKIVATANAQNLYLAINVFSQYFLKMYYFFHLCTVTDVFNSNMILSNKAPAKNKAGKSALSPKKRGRPAGVKNKNNSAADTASTVVAAMEKQPGDVSFPLTCWSLTITRTGIDIHTSLLDNMKNQFLQDVCTRGLFIMKIIVQNSI